MNSRERVLAAINHQEPDQIPVDMGSNPSSGISAMGYTKLKKALGIKGGHTRIFDVVQQLAQPEDDVIDALGLDIIDIGRVFNTSDDDWYDITMLDGSTAQYPTWFHHHNATFFRALAFDGQECAAEGIGQLVSVTGQSKASNTR